VRWQPVSPTLMTHLQHHARQRHAPATTQLLPYCLASEFLNHSIFEIPSHGSACLTDREAVDDVESTVRSGSRKTRRRLSPSEKYEIFVQVLTGQATQREAADRAGVDRSTVVHVCRTAKQGALDALAASVPGGRA
jgi:hypothetical protein